MGLALFFKVKSDNLCVSIQIFVSFLLNIIIYMIIHLFFQVFFLSFLLTYSFSIYTYVRLLIIFHRTLRLCYLLLIPVSEILVANILFFLSEAPLIYFYRKLMHPVSPFFWPRQFYVPANALTSRV